MTKLISATSFGPESTTYVWCRPLARFYSLASGLKDHYEMSSTSDLRPGEVHIDDDRFITGDLRRVKMDQHTWSEKRPIWAIEQCINQINMLLEFYRFLLKNYEHPFWLYGHTLTSIVHWPSILRLIETLPCAQIFAGKPLVLANHFHAQTIRIPSVGTGPYMLGMSGAGILMSSDLISKILERKDFCTHHVPSDVWLSAVLSDIPKIPLARRDLSVSEAEAESLLSIILSSNFVESEISRGNFHFRVNSLANLSNPNDRHHIDPNILSALACKLLSVRTVSSLHREAGLEEAAGFLQYFRKNADSTYGSEFIVHE